MDNENVVSLEDRIRAKQKAQFADAVAESMGISTQELADITDSSLDDIHQSLIECVQRQSMYHAYDELQKERERNRGMDPDTCFNAVCPDYVSYEAAHEEHDAEDPPGVAHIVYTGRRHFCREGHAQGCIFRLLEHPYSDPFVDIPSHNECVRILQRIGYVRGGSFEDELGTHFMEHKNTRKLWEAYVLLLVETGKLAVPEERLEELAHLERQHAMYVEGNEPAHEYFKDRELPDTVATVAELVAQRNALLAFIRGELDWPEGRCPCGEDFHWNGVAHTERCRFNPTE